MAPAASDHRARFGASLVAAGVAEVLTLPIDQAKVRLQVQQVRADGSRQYAGMVDCIRQTRATEGGAALWKGLQPSLLRQCCYTSLSMVLYEPVRDAVVAATGGLGGDGKPGFAQRLLAGGTAGGVAIAVFNWTEVLKTRMQTSKTKVTMREVAREVLAKDGPLGFWKGLKPNVARTFMVNAAELGTYDQVKTMLVPHVGDNPLAHLGASSVSAVCSALTSTPADVIKSRLMNSSAAGAPQYSGVVDALTTIVRVEGAGALYKGFTPIIVRKVLWVSSFFLLYEQLRARLRALEPGQR
jgi:hypothetical protein